jgi:hypothetical protein
MKRLPFVPVTAVLVLLAALLTPPVSSNDTPHIELTHGMALADLAFRHENGAFGKKYLPETMGSGCAFLDYDNDGWLDIFLVNSTRFPGQSGKPVYSALFRNTRDGRFENVTRRAGLAVEMYGIGVAAADYDNDGWTDLYVTAVGGSHLFHNRGDGRFEDVTEKAGAHTRATFPTSAMFFDYDKDGSLDLVVANYVRWSIEADLFCTLDGQTKSYCTPESYEGESPTLLHNRGDGTFEDATRSSGVWSPDSKALGVALLDYDGDGWLDFALANDTQPNQLFRNDGDGTFTEVGMLAGMAFDEAGKARAGMGIDSADFSRSGRPGLLIANFSNEMLALYSNVGNGLYVDDAPTSAVGRNSLLTLAFSVFFFDYDLDGELDIFAGNGHVADDINVVQPGVTHAEPPHLFRNLGDGRFEEVTDEVGPDFSEPVVARGAAQGDFDNDGDLDIVVNVNGGPAVLYRNDGANQNRFVRVKTIGTESNRDGIGARVTVTRPDGQTQWRRVHTGSSYASQSDTSLTFGLGSQPRARSIEVAWPSGQVDRIEDVPANHVVWIKEGEGLLASKTLPEKGGAFTAD